MTASHLHSDIEVNLVRKGFFEYLGISGTVRLPAGSIAVFWAAFPHRLVDFSEHAEATWITIPLGDFLTWQFPEAFARTVLSGRILKCGALRGHPGLELSRQWEDDLNGKTAPARRTAAGLEIRAYLLRWIEEAAPTQAKRENRPSSPTLAKVAQIAEHLAIAYKEEIRISNVARMAGWRPEYATTAFRKILGLSIQKYLAALRVAHAQNLLLTTEMHALEIGFASGFNSASCFYAAFQQHCGTSPRKWKTSLAHCHQ